MTSNAYIATDEKTVLKVGKTNNFWKRMEQIGLPMTAIISCPDEATALRIETELRHIAVEMGGIRHPEKIDWFEFDADIHMMLQAFLESLRGYVPTYVDGLPDGEITRLRKEYVQQLKGLHQATIKEHSAQNRTQKQEINLLKRQVAYLEADRDRLSRQIDDTKMLMKRENDFLREQLEIERKENRERFWDALNWEGKYIQLRSYAKTLGFIDDDTDI